MTEPGPSQSNRDSKYDRPLWRRALKKAGKEIALLFGIVPKGREEEAQNIGRQGYITAKMTNPGNRREADSEETQRLLPGGSNDNGNQGRNSHPSQHNSPPRDNSSAVQQNQNRKKERITAKTKERQKVADGRGDSEQQHGLTGRDY
jgi:hypothetical protein